MVNFFKRLGKMDLDRRRWCRTAFQHHYLPRSDETRDKDLAIQATQRWIETSLDRGKSSGLADVL